MAAEFYKLFLHVTVETPSGTNDNYKTCLNMKSFSYYVYLLGDRWEEQTLLPLTTII